MSYIGTRPTIGNFVKLDSIVTSATTTFNLLNGGVAYYPQSANHCLVSLNGILQAPTDSFTISGSTIIFSSALTTSDVIDFIIVLGDVLNIGTPSDATVGFSKITSNLITGATAETSIAGGDSILIYDDSATALRKMTRTNFVSGIGGTNTPAFQAYLSSNQSVSNGVWTKLQANTENFDTASCYDNATNYRFTPTTSGKYFVYGGICAAGNAADNQISMSRIYKNGSAITQSDSMLRTDYTASAVFSQFSAFVGFVVDMNGSTDYLEMYGMSQKSNGANDRFDANCSKWGAYKLIE
jgi:hypothetical protein